MSSLKKQYMIDVEALGGYKVVVTENDLGNGYTTAIGDFQNHNVAHNEKYYPSFNDAYARRIVAALNYVAGISTDELEARNQLLGSQ
jgi:hypothetical protein